MTHALLVITTVAVLEGLLSADNALVLAILVRVLPKEQQKKALLYGIGGAFIFRFLAILSAATLIRYWYLQALGAFYLAYLAVSHFARHASAPHGHQPKPAAGFWRTVVMVELTDIAFAIDSILAAVALTPEIWLVYTGGILGMIFMRYAASWFIKLLEKFPNLEHAAYLVIGWISVKLGLEAASNWQASLGQPWHWHLPPALFWCVTFALFGVGFIGGRRAAGRLKEEQTNKE